MQSSLLQAYSELAIIIASVYAALFAYVLQKRYDTGSVNF